MSLLVDILTEDQEMIHSCIIILAFLLRVVLDERNSLVQIVLVT